MKAPKKQVKTKKPQRKPGRYYKRYRTTLDNGNPIPVRPTRTAVRDVRTIFKKASPHQRAVFSFLFKERLKYDVVCHTQATIAEKVGCSVKTVERALMKWERLGFISNNYRHKKSSVYEIASIFFCREYFYKLRKLLPVLLLLFAVGVGQPCSGSKRFKKRLLLLFVNSSKSVYVENGTPQHYGRLDYDPEFYQNDPDDQFNNNNRGDSMSDNLITREKREVIEAIASEVSITVAAQAKLALFPVESTKSVLNLVLKIKKSGDSVYNAEHFLISRCMKEAPFVDVSASNPVLKAIMQAQDQWPHVQTPLADHPSKPQKGGGHVPGTYDQSALAKKAHRIQDNYTEYNDRPRHGDPILDEHVQAYNQRVYGRPYEHAKHVKRASPQRPPTRDKVPEEIRKSLAEICDDYTESYLKTTAPRPRAPEKESLTAQVDQEFKTPRIVIPKEYAQKGLRNMIIQHCDLYVEHAGMQKAIDYIEYNIFQVAPPESVKQGALLTETGYFRILEEVLQDYHEEIKENDARNNNNHTG
ncbi:MAG: hypothetical protein JRJ79_17920 [Deltaproteobacteria bacterium]|nr:hypothetical protein [Deltaproteobacteria bacterium]